MVDPDEGTTLEFIPVSEFKGTKCAKLAQEDIEEKVNYWQNAMICCVLGANPPYEVLVGRTAGKKHTKKWNGESDHMRSHKSRIRHQKKLNQRSEDDFQLATKHITRHYVPRVARPKETATLDDLLQVNFYDALLEEDVIQEEAGMIGFLETKAKDYNIKQVMSRVCPNWQWEHNATMTNRGKIILSWHPRRYQFIIILKTDQLIHGEAIHLPTNQKFTFLYGKNLEEQRLPLWENLMALSQTLEDPWCVLGDFNSVLHQGERIGGLAVTDGEVKDFAACIQHCGL
ncbi:hypothetical protein Cgig2_024719 [Carnegiea gigantea]|uniref:Reverse transcriptase n=1 Tax=Carnegiea gigantea TaxID=171969 RepID=A0A9Q1Q5R0_9CARY|nr:hypothetical protein Cgig2_024719 [Carnegiea gigantea]